MPIKDTILLQGFHGGIGNHDTYLGENQVAYAENVFLRDPEYVSLNQKPENFALTDNDLVTSKLEGEHNGHYYLGTEGGKMYDAGSNIVLCTTALGKAITMILDRVTYIYFTIGPNNLGRIDETYLVDGSSWVAGDLEVQATYTETHITSTASIPIKSFNLSSTQEMVLTQSRMRIADNSFTYTDLANLNGIGVGLRKTLNYWKAFTHKGILAYNDGSSTLLNATLDLDSFYVEGIYAKNYELLISGLLQENSNIFMPNGEGKTLIAQARYSGPEGNKVHHYGRNELLNGFTDYRYKQHGNDTHGSYNNICYMINNSSVMGYGSVIPGLPDAWNIELTRNYNGDLIEAVGMVKVENDATTGENRLYYSWRSGVVCGVDRIDLDKMGRPDTYASNGYFFTQKFNFGDAKASINKIKVRALTNAGQTIKIYSCVNDSGAWELKQTLNGSDPKKYFLLDSHEECYTIQRKIEFTTDDVEASPELYAFKFNYTIGDNE